MGRHGKLKKKLKALSRKNLKASSRNIFAAVTIAAVALAAVVLAAVTLAAVTPAAVIPVDKREGLKINIKSRVYFNSRVYSKKC